MDKEIMKQFQLMTNMMEKLSDRMTTLEEKTVSKDEIELLTDRSTSKAAALVEERLGRRLDTLMDGYKLTYEKQYELELKPDRLQDRVDDVEVRVASLESNTR